MCAYIICIQAIYGFKDGKGKANTYLDYVSLLPAITDQIKLPADKHMLVTLNY